MLERMLKDMEPKMQKALEAMQEELATIHTGRASTSLVDDIMVEVYGSPQPIKAVATISIPDPKSILISAWDRTNLPAIEKAIRESDLNLSPANTGENIRINLPDLTEDRRKEYVRLVHAKAEEAKISVRNIRSDAWIAVKKAKTDGDISEDDMYRGEQDIQKIVDKYNSKIEEVLAIKEKELLTI